MTEQNPAIFLQAGSHPAEDVRRFIGASMANRAGIVAPGDLAVTQAGTPNMTVVVAGGQAFVAGSEGSYQGLYFVENRGNTTLSIAAADATNPRYDLVVARVRDAAYSGATNAWSLAVVTGTPAASPAEPAVPANCLVLARVSVAALATSITNANITDRRVTPGLYTGNPGGRAAALGGVIVCSSGARPSSPKVGDAIYETDTGFILVWNGSAWTEPVRARTGGTWTCGVQAIANATISAISWTTENADSSGFATPTTTTVTIPSGLTGTYAVSLRGAMASAPAGGVAYLSIFGQEWGCDLDSANTFNRFSVTAVLPIPAGTAITANIYHQAGGSVNLNGARLDVYRVAD